MLCICVLCKYVIGTVCRYVCVCKIWIDQVGQIGLGWSDQSDRIDWTGWCANVYVLRLDYSVGL